MRLVFYVQNGFIKKEFNFKWDLTNKSVVGKQHFQSEQILRLIEFGYQSLVHYHRVIV